MVDPIEGFTFLVMIHHDALHEQWPSTTCWMQKTCSKGNFEAPQCGIYKISYKKLENSIKADTQSELFNIICGLVSLV